MLLPDHAIVIGAGIAGCSTAYALAERGMRVRLIERHAHIARAASGNPLAMLYPRLSGDDIATEFALAGYRHSLALYKKLQLAPADFSQCGLLQLGFNGRELARIKKVAAQFQTQSMPEYLSAAAASHIAGICLDHDALYFPDAAWINPAQLCSRLIDHENITLITLTNIDNILKNIELFEIYSDAELVAKAAVVVIANANDAYSLGQSQITSRLNASVNRHAQAPFSLRFDLQTQAVRGQISLLNATATSRKLQTIVCSDGYISPAHNEQHCLGASFNADSQDLSLNAADHLANLDKLHIMSPALYQSLNTEISGGRAALRCNTSDYLPLVGELLDSAELTHQPPRPHAAMHTLPWIKGLYVNLAHGSKGFSSAPLCAELLASMICQQPLPLAPSLAGRLNPNRFLLRALGLKHLAKMVARAEPPPVSG